MLKIYPNQQLDNQQLVTKNCQQLNNPTADQTSREILRQLMPNENQQLYLCDPQWFRDTASRGPTTIVAPESQSGLAHRIMELIEEDLLCYFRFSWKKVQLVGDIGERMSKAEMMKDLKEKKADPEGTSLSLSKGKRKAPEEGGERRKKHYHEKKTKEPARETVYGGRTSDISLSVEWRGGQSPSSSTDEVTMTRRSMEGMLTRQDGLMKQLEEMRAISDKEKESMLLELEISRSQSLHLEKENKALHSEVEKLKGEAENSWELEKEKFLQSKEFKIQCSGKALAFFEKGFDGCLAQFRANGYSEEEHPAPFLDVERALEDMSDDEDSEEGSLGRDEAPPA
ncbi:hypothetical protein F511_26224 [Dorcoceras hygrometricum]|uniref:Uncharacterized protein n=1 Tax=Dorcoceras hygrometricum TaxID=472368 RepID=A0A2Z7B346_9LAMI|nr:hypothetical protein F511_26224 [Dorcoceras hygrometricum]